MIIAMNPIKIKVQDNSNLYIKWEDDSESILSLKYIRDECPCASCKGETILLKTYRPPKPSVITPDMYKIKNIETVGEYAIKITWQDEHNTGIYTWDYLNELESGEQNNTDQNYKPLI